MQDLKAKTAAAETVETESVTSIANSDHVNAQTVISPLTYAKNKPRWGSIGFFVAIPLFVLIGIPWYASDHGILTADWILFATYSFLTILAITAGYHRLYAHRAYRTNDVMEFLLLFFGAAAVQQSALKWAALHRQHHKYTDTDRDPYNIKRGFFHAHIGWLLFWKYNADFDGVRDMQSSRLVMHQHNYFQQWALVAGVLTPVLIGILYGSPLGGLIFGVGLRLTLVYHSTFLINSAAHSFGDQHYDRRVSARDSFICAVLTNGEGYHNFHHRFPSDYRNGYLSHHWDPTKWCIWLWSKMGLASSLIKTPERSVQETAKHSHA